MIGLQLLDTSELPQSFIQSVRAQSRADADRAAWHAARLGKITGSRFGVVKKTARGEWGETAESYLYELVGEWLTGQPSDSFTGSRATEWGNQHEADALRKYAERTGREVMPGKFFKAGSLRLVGGTPDGLIGVDGIVEAKCPYTPKNHIRTVLSGCVPPEYQDQVDGHLMLTGREWCDFVSYDPRIPDERIALAVVRVHRDEERIQNLLQRLTDFETLLIERLATLGVDIEKTTFKIEIENESIPIGDD